MILLILMDFELPKTQLSQLRHLRRQFVLTGTRWTPKRIGNFPLPNKTKLKFAKYESHRTRKIVFAHLLENKKVKATETAALENQNPFSVLESTVLSRSSNQWGRIPIKQAQCTPLARCIIYVERLLQERNSVKLCLQYRLIKPSKISFMQVTTVVQQSCISFTSIQRFQTQYESSYPVRLSSEVQCTYW